MSTFSERTAEKIARSRAVHVALRSESRKLRAERENEVDDDGDVRGEDVPTVRGLRQENERASSALERTDVP